MEPSPVYTMRPPEGRLVHQRLFGTLATGTRTIRWDPYGPAVIPRPAVNPYTYEGPGIKPPPLIGGQDPCSPIPKDNTIWLVGLMLGSRVDVVEVQDVAGAPLDSIRYDSAVRIPFPASPKLLMQFQVTTTLGVSGDLIFELVWATF